MTRPADHCGKLFVRNSDDRGVRYYRRTTRRYFANREIFRPLGRYQNATAMNLLQTILLSAALVTPVATAGPAILLIAGPKSHGPGEHEHQTGCELLARHLQSSGLALSAEVSLGWPQDAAKIAAADTIVIFGDGTGINPAVGHVPALRQHYEAGKGLVVLHWALEPADPVMAALFDDALGGRFETNWSVNPIWQMTNPIIAKG